MIRTLCLTLLVLLLLLAGAPAFAQADEEGPAPELPARDDATPAGAVRLYIEACRAGDYGSAVRFLDLSSFPEAVRGELGPRYARQLKVVLDRALWIQYDLLSNRPRGELEDGLPDDFERLGNIEGVDILLERQGNDIAAAWRLSSGTVERIPLLYEKLGYGRLGELLPSALFEVGFLELRLWQWIGLAVLVFAVYLASWLLAKLLFRIALMIVRRTASDLDDRLLVRLVGPLRLALALLLFIPGTLALKLALPAREFLAGVEKAIGVLAVTWGLLRCIDVIADRIGARMEEEGRVTAVAVLPLGRRAAKVALLALAVIATLQNLGFNVTGLLAGVGVGGLAVALAAQKSIANLFGGVSLIADRPVRVGDFCRFGTNPNQMGTVEEVGLRSTRIRTLDRTLVTVPNAEFSEFQLENYGARDRMRLYLMIGLIYQTSPDQLRWVLTELRKLLVAHPMITEDPARVRFVGFGPHSLDLEIFAYVPTGDWAEFLRVREDIMLRIMDVVAASGSSFAYPSQTLYLGRDAGADVERQRAAEAEVREWRQSATLPFPDLPDTTKRELDGSLDWPPAGSVARPREP
jgi:MscS family membrane protein